MKKILIIIIILSLRFALLAQDSSVITSPKLPMREVSGIVKDEKGETVIGATVTLKSNLDTVTTTTNEDGIFVFKNVKLARFNVTVKSGIFQTFVQKYLNNDVATTIVLDPIILKMQFNVLSEVVIDVTPSITYKTDTVEYRAKDYKVGENATVDELLKRMEGMEVDKAGMLTYQGQQVTKARVNGKDFAGGDVAQAILNLPADIVEKAQIVNDYGDQANRTGIKDGDPTKVLNLTTKAERSVGNTLRLTAGAGSNDRYDERLFAQRLNANQQISIIANIQNTLNGIALESGSPVANSSMLQGLASNGLASNGGTTSAGNFSFNYRDQWSKFLQVNTSYGYTFNNIESINNSLGENLSSLGATSFNRNINSSSDGKSHNANLELEYVPDSSNFFRITNIFRSGNSNSLNTMEYTQVGLQNQYSKGTSSSIMTNPNYEAIVLYQYLFKRNRNRNFSIQLNASSGNQQQFNEQNTNIQFQDVNQNGLLDSLVHRSINRGNLTNRYRSSFTYIEPTSKTGQFEFNAQTNYRGYENNATTRNIGVSGSYDIDSLSNRYKYSFTESRVSLNYKLSQRRYSLSIGLRGIPTFFVSNNISKSVKINRSNFYLVPLFRFQYQWSSTKQLHIDYIGNPTEPTFIQIQPIPDYSDPQNPIFGNSGLKPVFTHSIISRFDNYIANSELNLSAGLKTNFFQNKIENNVIQVFQPALNTYSNEIHYVNVNGSYSVLGNYNVSKRYGNRKYQINLNGTVSYNYDIGMTNNIMRRLTMWNINTRFGPKINPNSSIEINPFILYNINTAFNSVPVLGIAKSLGDIRTTAINLEGKFNLSNKGNRFTIQYSVSKNYVSGIEQNLAKNPFVINAYIEKVIFKSKKGVVRISAFDILGQNNFINHVVTTNGYTDTKTNTLSRYLSFSFVLNLQKWTGIAKRDGSTMERRGDGSFIY